MGVHRTYEVSFHDVWKSNCYAEVLCVNCISIKLKRQKKKNFCRLPLKPRVRDWWAGPRQVSP